MAHGRAAWFVASAPAGKRVAQRVAQDGRATRHRALGHKLWHGVEAAKCCPRPQAEPRPGPRKPPTGADVESGGRRKQGPIGDARLQPGTSCFNSCRRCRCQCRCCRLSFCCFPCLHTVLLTVVLPCPRCGAYSPATVFARSPRVRLAFAARSPRGKFSATVARWGSRPRSAGKRHGAARHGTAAHVVWAWFVGFGFVSICNQSSAVTSRSAPVRLARLRPNHVGETSRMMQNCAESYFGEHLLCDRQFRPRDTSAGHGAARGDTTRHGRPQQCKECHSTRSAARKFTVPARSNPFLAFTLQYFRACAFGARSARVRRRRVRDRAFAARSADVSRESARSDSRVRSAIGSREWLRRSLPGWMGN